jgi:hypothetical protein
MTPLHYLNALTHLARRVTNFAEFLDGQPVAASLTKKDHRLFSTSEFR